MAFIITIRSNQPVIRGECCPLLSSGFKICQNEVMKILILSFIFFLSLSNITKAEWLQVQPIVGLERIQKLSPVVKTKTRTVVGARALFGPPGFSLEAEVTRASDSETLYEQDLKEEEESYAAKLGVRSSFNLAILRWYLRAGGQARRSEVTRTQAGVTTKFNPAVNLSPYAGTGFSVNLAGNLFANGGVTVIFTGKPKGSDREYQTTFGFGVRI